MTRTQTKKIVRQRFEIAQTIFAPLSMLTELLFATQVDVKPPQIQRFQVQLAPGARVEPEPSITLRLKFGLPVRLVAR